MEEEGEEVGWEVWLVGGDVTSSLSWSLAVLSPSVAILLGKGQGTSLLHQFYFPAHLISVAWINHTGEPCPKGWVMLGALGPLLLLLFWTHRLSAAALGCPPGAQSKGQCMAGLLSNPSISCLLLG